MIQKRSECYCAFCKNTRKIYTSKHLNFAGIVGLILFSYLLTHILWQHADVRGLAILALFLVVGEGFSQLRWRQSMVCTHCGFDPVLYIKDVSQAAVNIQNFIKRRSEKPEYLLKPALKLPVRKMIHSDLNNQQQEHISIGKNLSLRG